MAALLVLLAVAIFPVLSHSVYYVTIGNQIGIYAIAALGLCLLLGYAGQVSMGQAAFFALGAYASALLSTKTGWNPWFGIALGMIISAVVAALIGIPLFRLEGHVLAVASLGLAIIVYTLLVQLRSLTGGFDGVSGIPPLSIAGFSFNSDHRVYHLIWFLVLLGFLFARNLVHSREGRALRSIHIFAGGNERAASVLGVYPHHYKLKIFIISACYASLAGSLWAHWVLFINPEPFAIFTNILLLIMVTIGGMGNLYGALIGPAVIVLSGEAFRSLIPKLVRSQGATGEIEVIAYGLLLIVILIALPQGLAAAPEEVASRWRRRSAKRSQTRAAETCEATQDG